MTSIIRSAMAWVPRARIGTTVFVPNLTLFFGFYFSSISISIATLFETYSGLTSFCLGEPVCSCDYFKISTFDSLFASYLLLSLSSTKSLTSSRSRSSITISTSRLSSSEDSYFDRGFRSRGITPREHSVSMKASAWLLRLYLIDVMSCLCFLVANNLTSSGLVRL